MRKCLIEGLSQASVDCMLPEVVVRKYLKGFFEDVDELFPLAEYHRFIAHPPLPSDFDPAALAAGIVTESSIRLSQFRDTTSIAGIDTSDDSNTNSSSSSDTSSIHSSSSNNNGNSSNNDSRNSVSDSPVRRKTKIVIAVGPEGGWDDEEVRSFVQRGFHVVSLGERILRTDIAVRYCYWMLCICDCLFGPIVHSLYIIIECVLTVISDHQHYLRSANYCGIFIYTMHVS
jgi:hypothetical protein